MYLTRLHPGSSGDPVVDATFRDWVAQVAREGISEADYHAVVQADLVASLRKHGTTIEENLRLYTSCPAWTYDADFITKQPLPVPKCVVEIKISTAKKDFGAFDGSEYRRKQFQVFVFTNLGGAKLGLSVGVPLESLAVMLIYALPGQSYEPHYMPPGDFQEVFDWFKGL